MVPISVRRSRRLITDPFCTRVHPAASIVEEKETAGAHGVKNGLGFLFSHTRF